MSHDLRSDLADPSAYGRQHRDALEEAIVALKAAEEWIADARRADFTQRDQFDRQRVLRMVQAAVLRLERQTDGV